VLFAAVYAIVVWFVPSLFWRFREVWFKHMIKRSRYFLPTFNSSIFILHVVVPMVTTWVFQGKDLSSMGFYLPPSQVILLFTLVPYVIFFALFFIEYWYKVSLKRQSIDSVLPIPKNYSREFLDQVFCVAFPEEVLIRGYLLSNLLDFGPMIAVVVSSVIFSLHPGHLLGGKARFFRTSVVAVVLGVTFIYAGIIPCIILHFLGNLLDPRVARAILLRSASPSAPK